MSVHDYWKNRSFDYTDFCWQSDVSAFNMLFRCVVAFLPRSKSLLISRLQSPHTVILQARKIKSVVLFLKSIHIHTSIQIRICFCRVKPHAKDALFPVQPKSYHNHHIPLHWNLTFEIYTGSPLLIYTIQDD